MAKTKAKNKKARNVAARSIVAPVGAIAHGVLFQSVLDVSGTLMSPPFCASKSITAGGLVSDQNSPNVCDETIRIVCDSGLMQELAEAEQDFATGNWVSGDELRAS